MKHTIYPLFIFVFLLFPTGSFAKHTMQERLSVALTAQTARVLGTDLMKQDAYGTPYFLKLARQGDTQILRQAAQTVASGDFLLAKDRYGNNMFHVAKDAATIQVLASLVRQFYGSQTLKIIHQLADERNRLGETPLMAQINAGHADTFRPLYTYTTLKVKNDAVNNQVLRWQGMDENIIRQNRADYCEEVINLSSANGRTLLQAAQDQVPYNPAMGRVVQDIRQTITCLN